MEIVNVQTRQIKIDNETGQTKMQYFCGYTDDQGNYFETAMFDSETEARDSINQ